MSLISIDEGRLSELLSQEFTSEEQVQFVLNFRLYLTYGNSNDRFVVDFDKVWKWMGFAQKITAKRMMVKTFVEDVDYIVSNNVILLDSQATGSEVVVADVKDARGGHNKEYIYLNVNTFKTMCMLVNTDRGKETRRYYLKMESIFFKYCEEQTRNQITGIQEDAVKFKRLSMHLSLMKGFDKKSLVYMMQVLCPHIPEGKLLIKMGYTDDLADRVYKIRSMFGCEVFVLHVFVCENNKGFEKFIFNHKSVAPLRYTSLVGTNQVKSLECFLMDNDNTTFEVVRRVLEKNVIYYKAKSAEVIKAQAMLAREYQEQLRMQRDIDLIRQFDGNPEGLTQALSLLYSPKPKVSQNRVDSGPPNADMHINDIENQGDEQEDTTTPDAQSESSIAPEDVQVTRSSGPKVQIYNVNDIKEVVQVFDSITEATRQVADSSYSAIKKAAKQRIPYMGYRWFFIGRDDPEPSSVHDIGMTVVAKTKTTGMIAMINLDKNKVLNVFPHQKRAADYITQEVSAMSIAVKTNKHLSGSYWVHWDDVNEDMKKAFLDRNQLPEKVVNIRGVVIEQVDTKTNKVIQTHNSITDVAKAFKMSTRKVKALAQDNAVYKGFMWRLKSRV